MAKSDHKAEPPPSSGEPQLYDFQTRRNRRLIPFVVITVLGFILLLSQLIQEQVFHRDKHLEREKQQTMRRILLPGPRGNVLDRNGELLIGNRARFSAAVFLNSLRKEFRREYLSQTGEIKRREAETGEEIEISNSDLIWGSRMAVVQAHLDEISEILGRDVSLSQRELISHFNNRILLPLKLVSDLSEEEYARLVDQLPPNSPVHVWTESARYYPYGDLAAHSLGYVVSREENTEDDEGADSNLMTFSYYGKVGKTGVERSFDQLLGGTRGHEVWRVDPQGFQYERLSLVRPEQGEDLHLSIDVAVQQAAQRGLEGKVGAAVAIDPQTGEILAIASSPTYDLNDLTPFIPSDVYREIDEAGGWLHRAIQGLYPPGSTFKPITAIAAFRKGVLDPEEILTTGASYRVGNRNFPEHTPPGFGEIALPRALAVSSNVFFYEIGLRAGIDWIADTARLFGMDEKTGIELPFETSRQIVPTRQWKQETQGSSWFPGDTANTSIGQGFLRVTPLQMAVVAAELAIGKTGLQPTLVRQGEDEDLQQELAPLPLTAEEYETVVMGMIRAVEEGTARRTRFPDMVVAGKTGTAQVYPGGKPLTLAWFIGFAPVENPRIAVAIVIEGVTEEDQFHGGTTAAPVAKEIFDAWKKSKTRQQETLDTNLADTR